VRRVPTFARPGGRGARMPHACEQYRCRGRLGRNGAPHLAQTSSGSTRFLRPQCVSSVAAQFGQTIRRFSSRWSSRSPLMWSRIKPSGWPRHSSPWPQSSHRRGLRPTAQRRRFSDPRSKSSGGRGSPRADEHVRAKLPRYSRWGRSDRPRSPSARTTNATFASCRRWHPGQGGVRTPSSSTMLPRLREPRVRRIGARTHVRIRLGRHRAGEPGLEPGLCGPKPHVLPIHHSPVNRARSSGTE
jgi:hypothetical protein